MNEGTCVTVEINGLSRVEEHILTRIDLEDEVLERTQTYFTSDFVCLVGSDTLQGIDLVLADLTCVFDHLLHQIIGIDYRTLTALHLTVRQFHHTVREMYEFLAKRKTETVKKDRQHFEMVLLFVADHIDHLIDGVVLEPQLGSTYILRHIDRCAVRTEQQFLIQTVLGEVSPDGTVLTAVELTGG